MAVTSPPPDSTRPRRYRIRAIAHKPAGGRMRFDKDAIKDLLLIIVLPALLVIAAFWIAARYVQPAPPNAFVMTPARQVARITFFCPALPRYLAREKITITLKPSPRDGKPAASARCRLRSPGRLVQAGMVTGDPPPGLHSLGAMYYEPLWIFYRGNAEIDKLSQLSGKRVAVGAEGSGTRALALLVLKTSGVDASSTTLSPLGGNDAAKALIEGTLDAALLVAALVASPLANCRVRGCGDEKCRIERASMRALAHRCRPRGESVVDDASTPLVLSTSRASARVPLPSAPTATRLPDS